MKSFKIFLKNHTTVFKSIFLICGTGDLSFAIRIQIPLLPTRGGEMWEDQFLQQAFVRGGTVGKRSISMGKSWKLHLYDTITGKSSVVYKLRKLGESYEKLFHVGACLGGLRSLKMLLAVPKSVSEVWGLEMCKKAPRILRDLEGWCCFLCSSVMHSCRDLKQALHLLFG